MACIHCGQPWEGSQVCDRCDELGEMQRVFRNEIEDEEHDYEY